MYAFSNVIDMDFSAMYPHIIIAFNIERHTMISKIIIPEFTEDRYDHFFVSDEIVDIVYDEDAEEEDKEFNIGYDSGKDFLDNYLTGDILSMGTKWFNLPDVNEVNELMKERFKIKPRRRHSISNFIKYFIDQVNININKD